MNHPAKPLTVIYSPRQHFDPGSFSKSPTKARMLAEHASRHPKCYNVIEPSASFSATVALLKRVHDPKYVEDIINGAAIDGFGTTTFGVPIVHTCANFLSAAVHAQNPQSPQNPPVIFSLTSGFHHATHRSAQGFCTFNALMLPGVAWPHRKFLIVDGDYHWGNGCEEASQNPNGNTHYFQCHDKLPFFEHLLKEKVDQIKPDMILYQAGADAWINDPLGGAYTTAELIQRDKIVLDLKLPTVMNLAGGYARDYQDTINIHKASLAVAALYQ